MDDDDDENTYAHEAGRNFSKPHQDERRDLHYSLILLLFFFVWGGGGGGEGGSSGFWREASHFKVDRALDWALRLEAQVRHPNALCTGLFNPASIGPKKLYCQFIPTHYHVANDTTDFPAL